jgi:hypothetical protein
MGELTPTTPVVVNGVVAGDPEEPSGQIATGLEALESARNVQENLLCKLISFFYAAGELIRDVPNLPVITRN